MSTHRGEQAAWLLLPALLVVATAACAEASRIADEQATCEGQIVFDARQDGISEVYVLAVDSGETKQLTHGGTPDNASRLPDVAPGGAAIVFGATDEMGVGNLVIMDASGEAVRPLLDKPAFVENPAWSPRGDWIAFEMAEEDHWGVYLVRPDGSGLQRVGPHDRDLFHPDWSPEQGRIAVITVKRESWVLAILDLSDGSLRELTGPELAAGSPKWSPDGTMLAFDAVGGSNFDLYLLHVATGEIERLTTDPAVDARPDWSPDGERLVFHSTRDNGGSIGGQERWEEFELHTLDLRTRKIERLTNNDRFDGHPDWCVGPVGLWSP